MVRFLRKPLFRSPAGLGTAALVYAMRFPEPPDRVALEERITTVRVVEAESLRVVPRAVGHGSVKPGKVWEAVAEVSGTVVYRHPELQRGTILPAGAELLRIGPTDYRYAVTEIEANIRAADSRIALLGRLAAPHAAAAHGMRVRFDTGLARFTERVVGRLVDAAVSWRYLAVGAVAGLFLASASVVAGGMLKFRLFPDIEGNVIEARMRLSQGTTPARTETVVERVAAAVRAVDEAYAAAAPAGRTWCGTSGCSSAATARRANRVNTWPPSPRTWRGRTPATRRWKRS